MKQIDPALIKLIEHFKSLGNFDHVDLKEIAQIGKKYGIDPLDAGKAFFIAREQSSLREGELLDGGTGEVADKTPLYGEDSIHSTLFDRQRK